MKTEIKTSEIVHFSIEGEWFTWLLRHLWIEGNEAKALRTWEAAFPNLMAIKHLKGVFIDIVSGKTKLVGQNSFNLKEDGTKYWSTTAGDEPNKSFPLLQSWEDVILLKRAKLYLSEIELRDFRLNRRFGETYESVNCNVKDWGYAADENNIENTLRNKVNEYWTTIRNLSITLELNLSLPLIPDKAEKLNTKTYFVPGQGRKQQGSTGIDEGLQMFQEVMGTIKPWDFYFKKKYGVDMLFIKEEQIRRICGVGIKKLQFYREDRAEEQVKKAQSVTQSIIPGLDLDKYIKGVVSESKRESIESEDVKRTEWTSGYIDKNGYFFGCADINHVNFSGDLCKSLKVDLKENKDAQIYLDKQGWIKVSVNRFYWDSNITPNKPQINTIFDYVSAKNISKTIYNKFNKPETFTEAFGDTHD